MKTPISHAVISLSLPSWLAESLPRPDTGFPDSDGRMRLVIKLARQNVDRGTGGTFAAAVFDRETGTIIAAGVNLVTSLNCSVAHAEIMAIMLAQQRIGTYDLGSEGMRPLELVASAEPCAMCLGAIPWSGVRRLVCGASGEDVTDIGFDEGAKPASWQRELEARGIEVVRNVCRSEAIAVLRRYVEQGGVVYNARRDRGP
jgi:tRNA(Arg) A34 adenosine deaminase TadA